MSVVPLHAPRWEPDDALIDAALNGRVHYDRLPESDRAWLVAQLTHRGHQNSHIAAWLHCSPRSVQNQRGHPVYALTLRLLQAESAAARKARPPAAPVGLAELVAERDRLRDQRNRLIDQLDAARTAAQQDCPPPVIILRPTHTPRRRAAPAPTLPLFEIGEPA